MPELIIAANHRPRTAGVGEDENTQSMHPRVAGRWRLPVLVRQRFWLTRPIRHDILEAIASLWASVHPPLAGATPMRCAQKKLPRVAAMLLAIAGMRAAGADAPDQESQQFSGRRRLETLVQRQEPRWLEVPQPRRPQGLGRLRSGPPRSLQSRAALAGRLRREVRPPFCSAATTAGARTS